MIFVIFQEVFKSHTFVHIMLAIRLAYCCKSSMATSKHKIEIQNVIIQLAFVNQSQITSIYSVQEHHDIVKIDAHNHNEYPYYIGQDISVKFWAVFRVPKCKCFGYNTDTCTLSIL